MPVYETDLEARTYREQKPGPLEEVFYLSCGVEGCFKAECGCHRWLGFLVNPCQDHYEERVGK